MSSILKALKKVEQEKSSRIPELLKIDSDILKSVDSSRRSASYTSLLLLLVFGGGAAAAYYFMNGSKAPQPTAVVPQAVTIKTVPAPVSAPVVPVPPHITEAIPARTAAVPARKAPAKTAGNGISGQPEKSDMASGEPVANVAVPALRVNGIAYQSSAADSMAIVNGTAVSNGSVIDGITVEDVRRDRVLFQYNGERFEIQLGQSNR